MKKTYSSIITLCISAMVFAQIPANYYDGITTETGFTLKTALRNIIANGHVSRTYNQLYDGVGITGSQGYIDTHTDNIVESGYENDNTILDMYSENPTGTDPYNFNHGIAQCGNQSAEGDCYNREHLVPQSAFNSNLPMQSDIHHVIPTDGRVNNFRGNLPFGEVATPDFTSLNGSKRGTSAIAGYSGTMFEPIDEFKGDIARALLYFATRYENTVDGYTSFLMFNGTNDQVFQTWAIDMLLDWHNNVDPVDQRERDRNDAAYNFQGNANPFVDHPEYVNLIWNPSANCTTPIDVNTLVATPGNTQINLSWINSSCFDKILIVAKANSPVTITPSGDGSAYIANSTFGSGTDLGTNEFAVFKGTSNSTSITALTNGTAYHFKVFTRKGTSWSSGVITNETPLNISTPSVGDIVISEIMYNTPGTDDEWIEIYNASGAQITLDTSWRLTYGSNTFDFAGTVIESQEYITIGLGSNGDGTFNNNAPFTPNLALVGTPATIATTNNTNKLTNSTATIAVIFDPNGSNITIDTVTYDDGSPWPTTADGNGPSLELIDLAGDNSLASSWAVGSYDGGTSGSAYNTFVFDNGWNQTPTSATSNAISLIVKNGTATLSENINSNTLTINGGSTLLISSIGNFIAEGAITNNGTLTLESTSTTFPSLITNSISGYGTTNYKRHVNNTATVGGTDSNDLISPPVSGEAFNTFIVANPNIVSNGTNTSYLFGPFDKTTGTYLLYANTETATLNVGTGYRAASTDNSTFTFTGTLNTGTINVPITNSGPAFAEWNLIGNPYTSYINVQDFLNNVTNTSLLDEINVGIYGYDGNASDGWTIQNLANTTALTVITPGQGFFVAAQVNGSIAFTPNMQRLGTTDDFIAGRAALVHLKLQINDASNTYSTDFYFNDNASLGLDPGYDAGVFGGNSPQFSVYSHLVTENVGIDIAIQTLGSTDLSDVTIPIGINVLQGQQTTVSVAEMSLPTSILVYLEDNVENTFTLLNDSDYTFTANTDLTETGRFFLRFSEEALSTSETELNGLEIYTSSNPKAIIIKGQLTDNTIANLYDIQGRLVLSKLLNQNSNVNQISTSSISSGIYIVQLQNNNQNRTQKVIIE